MDKLFINLIEQSSGTAYLSIFGVLVACGLGFPLPEDVPLIAAGYLCWEGTMSWIPTLFVTMTGVVIGDTALYYIGRKIGPSILNGNKIQSLFKPEKVKRTRAYFRKYGEKIVFFARFLAGIRAVAFFTAGAMHMRYSRFILYDAAAALISVPVWIGLGHLLGHYWGDQIDALLKSVKSFKHGITGTIILITAIVMIRYYLKYKKAKAVAAKASRSSKS